MAADVLVFERPRKRLMRWIVYLVSGLLIALSVVRLIAGGGDPSVLIPHASWPFFLLLLWQQSRIRTLVTARELRVRQDFRDRVIAAEDVADVVLMTRWSPVRLRLRSGETFELPNVPPDQADAVRDLVKGRKLPS